MHRQYYVASFRAGRRVLLFLITLFSLAAGMKAQEPLPVSQRHVFRQVHMGVDVTITLYGADGALANVAADKAFARIHALNGVFSDYDPDSEAMRLCHSSPLNQPQTVSADLWTILVAADVLSRKSAGAFSVHLGPLTKLWRRARRRGELPLPTALALAQSQSRPELVCLNRATRTVTVKDHAAQLDFGGIVKGYAAHEALLMLKQAGFAQSLVAIAGDIAAGAAPPGRAGWKIGVAPLHHSTGKNEPVPSVWLSLAETVVSTSGDAFQYVEIDGQRYSHIVDPHTGLGLTHRCSTTIIAPQGWLADGLATAATVLGPVKGLRLIEETPNAAGLIVTLDGDKPVSFSSSRLKRWLEPAVETEK